MVIGMASVLARRLSIIFAACGEAGEAVAEM
jgi:hypothetical protein